MADIVLGWVGYIKPDNVEIVGEDDPSVNIKIAKGENTSGQVRSKDWYHLGEFEADIMIPDNDGLLNGIFLYSNHESNKTNEVDIEIVKRDGVWQLLTTIYNPIHPNVEELNKLVDKPEDKAVVFSERQPLGFDPSKGFNNYKIIIDKDYVSFLVNDKVMSKWEGVFYSGEQGMRLHTGTFYVHWLNKEAYNKLTDKNKASLKSNGYKAYKYDEELRGTMDTLFGRNKDYFMINKNIKVKTYK